MGSIRPLFTITVLVVVGAYLYVKINEAPSRAPTTDAQSQGIPPLAAAGGGATLAQDPSVTAPTWPPANSTPDATASTPGAPALQAAPEAAASSSAAESAATSADTASAEMPEVPPIPEMPDFPKTADASTILPPAAATAIELPKNVPAAQYADEPGPKPGDTATEAAGNLPALPALPAETANNATPPIAVAPVTAPSSAANGMPAPPTGDPAANAVTPLSDDRYGTSPVAPATNPPSTPSVIPGVQTGDRYGMGATGPLPPAAAPSAATPSTAVAPPVAEAGDSFTASWPAIQAALDRKDLKTAHQLLSKWHGNGTLSPADSQKVETLLAQLAGTVIYSTEHQLEPPRVVKASETLETIAKEYNVPWQLLAKINGIPAANQVQPGQQLKVVRGPFNAVVDLHRNELTLEVDGRYAGTFPISVPPGTQVAEGQWLVDRKQDATASTRTIVLRSAATSAASLTAPTLTITANAAAPDPGMPGSEIQVAPQDAEDLSDILSVGSRVVVRR